jgi:exonuclease V gamma subunit
MQECFLHKINFPIFHLVNENPRERHQSTVDTKIKLLKCHAAISEIGI